MAFEIRKIDPLDLQPRKAVGVNLPFSGTSVFNSTFETKQAIKVNLINYLLTDTGERYFNVFFGLNLRRQLFDNITDEKLQFLSDQIAQGIRANFPRLIVNEIRLESNPDSNSILVILKYSISETNITDEQVVISIEQ